MLRPDSFAGEKLDPAVRDFFDNLKSFDALSKLFPASFTHLPDAYEVKHPSTYFGAHRNSSSPPRSNPKFWSSSIQTPA